jgi:hypothetical protein
MTRPLASLSWFSPVALVALLTACGGGTAAGKPAENAEPSGADSAEDDRATTDATSEGEATTEAPVPACSDGTCTPCGDGLCPNGWYCDETAKGGAACSWLPECAKKPGCACVERALSGCSCEERDGGPHVTCK